MRCTGEETVKFLILFIQFLAFILEKPHHHTHTHERNQQQISSTKKVETLNLCTQKVQQSYRKVIELVYAKKNQGAREQLLTKSFRKLFICPHNNSRHQEADSR